MRTVVITVNATLVPKIFEDLCEADEDAGDFVCLVFDRVAVTEPTCAPSPTSATVRYDFERDVFDPVSDKAFTAAFAPLADRGTPIDRTGRVRAADVVRHAEKIVMVTSQDTCSAHATLRIVHWTLRLNPTTPPFLRVLTYGNPAFYHPDTGLPDRGSTLHLSDPMDGPSATIPILASASRESVMKTYVLHNLARHFEAHATRIAAKHGIPELSIRDYTREVMEELRGRHIWRAEAASEGWSFNGQTVISFPYRSLADAGLTYMPVASRPMTVPTRRAQRFNAVVGIPSAMPLLATTILSRTPRPVGDREFDALDRAMRRMLETSDPSFRARVSTAYRTLRGEFSPVKRDWAALLTDGPRARTARRSAFAGLLRGSAEVVEALFNRIRGPDKGRRA